MFKQTIKKIPFIFHFLLFVKQIPARDYFCKRMKIKSLEGGYCKISKYINGQNNYMQLGKNVHLYGTKIRINGNNNFISFGDNCYVGKNCSFWMEGNNIKITIKKNTSFTQSVHFCAQEDDSAIIIGEDCMFSNTIIVRTSDSHPIYDTSTNKRINPAKNVIIGNHVWIAPNSKVMKGVTIGNGCIIGSDSMVTKDLPCNVLAVGHPAKIVKENIKWTREKLF